MEQLTNTVRNLLTHKGIKQIDLCNDLGINRYSFNRALNNDSIGLDTMEAIYKYLGIEFNLIAELKPIVAERLEEYSCNRLPDVIGITYSSARNFVNDGRGNNTIIKALYTNDIECHNIILKYCS